MRYYDFVLNTDQKQLKEKAVINLRDYSYDNPIDGMTHFMFSTMTNDITFLVYREVGHSLYAAFSFDEKKCSFEQAYSHISDLLAENFRIEKAKEEPEETTMLDFIDQMNEGARRKFVARRNYMVDASGIWIYPLNVTEEMDRIPFEYEERVIRPDVESFSKIYDRQFLKELSNIENHKNNSSLSSNLVHYFLSYKSPEAGEDMAEALGRSLFSANRLGTRRISFIKEIDPEHFANSHRLENIIENNSGGMIIIDLTEQFGSSPTQYGMVCKYLEKMVKQYKNECLFIFTYNTDHPGFSYLLLSNLGNYILPIKLREGEADRKTAIRYMEYLIRHSVLQLRYMKRNCLHYSFRILSGCPLTSGRSFQRPISC